MKKKKEKPPRLSVEEQLHMADQILEVAPPPNNSVSVMTGSIKPQK